MSSNNRTEKSLRIKKIVSFCKKEFRSLDEISEELGGISKNTVRAGYLYPLVREGVLIRNKNSAKKSVKYKSK